MISNYYQLFKIWPKTLWLETYGALKFIDNVLVCTVPPERWNSGYAETWYKLIDKTPLEIYLICEEEEYFVEFGVRHYR